MLVGKVVDILEVMATIAVGSLSAIFFCLPILLLWNRVTVSLSSGYGLVPNMKLEVLRMQP
jgi:ABC-type phosphate/phosphonate transport system permease subunit